MSLEARLRARRGGFALDVALRADAGGVTAVFGPSGAGKTTLVHALAGLIPFAEGRVALGDHVLLDTEAGVRLPAYQRRIGLVFQEGRLFPHLSVRANLLYGAKRSGGRTPPASLEDVVDTLGIAHLLERRPASLSGGERQRAALGRAILSAPDLLLLDEPLASLDGPRRAEILPFFERLRDFDRIPIVYVSHSSEEIARLADRVVALEAGRVRAEGSVEEVLSTFDAEGGEDFEPVSVLAAIVAGPPAADGLMELALDGETLFAPAFHAAPGDRIRLRIRAKDVMVALDRPERVSANNILPATIARARLTDASATLQLACGAHALAAQITRRAYDRLALREGLEVFAVIKSVTIAR